MAASLLDNNGDSDYGSDFSEGEEQLVGKLLEDLAHSSTTSTSTSKSTSTTSPYNNGQHQHQHHAPLSFTGLVQARESPSDHDVAGTSQLESDAMSSDSIRYPDLSQALSSLEHRNERGSGSESEREKERTIQTQPSPESPYPAVKTDADILSPLQRFRTFPKRPLTVSDMAAGAWCELQHWYTLTRLPGGRKTATAAMKGGTRVHQTLEEEVYSAVQVKIASKEEAFALRLWNIVQGLRTLRESGLTRELEVWGLVEGEVVNGVIDQLSHESPNATFEEELQLTPSSQQSSIVYLTDVKTRGSNRLPEGTALRPTRVQLFLYHRLLSDMAAEKVDYSVILERYGIDGAARFSDAFMAQIGSLHDEVFFDADSDMASIPPEALSPDLIRYRSVSQIIPLLKAELKETFPLGAASIGNLLVVQYRHREDGRILGNNSFPNDQEAMDAYVKENMRWWRGEREPEGVTIEETYKCSFCEFAESCQWRKDKEAEFLKKKKRGVTKIGRVTSGRSNPGPPWP